MKKKLQQLSVNTYTLFLLFVVLLFFLALIVFHNYKATSLLLNHVYYNTQDTVVLYQKQIDSELDRIETYLYTVAIDNADYTNLIYKDFGSTSWYSSLYHLNKNFNGALSVYTADGFLFYLPANDTFLFSNQIANISVAMQSTLRNVISGDDIFRDWEITEINGSCYLVRFINIGGARLGALVGVSSLLGSLTNTDSDEVALYLTTPENRLYGPGMESVELNFDILTDTYGIKNIDGQKMLIVQQPLSNGELYLTRMIPYSEVQALNASLNRDAFITTALFLSICLSLVFFVKRQIIRPVTNLTNALEEVSGGNLENHISTAGQLKEYRQMSTTFNEMVTEIKNLKIDVYEDKLQYQELENQYLKQQITPHFMINCLNTAYQLSEPEHLDLSRSMLMDLSRHLRYTLSSGQTVPLHEDLDLVKNYVEMSGIRYPGRLALYSNCPDAFRQAVIVPLLILNFIENTIKYEVVMGKVLEMHIDITSYETNDEIRLHICIWDNGKGFSPKMLARITDPSYPSAGDTSHIGITNVIFRMRHIFPDARFVFSNRPDEGAQIDIEFPYQPYEDTAKQGL